jgi:hypothetical protein
VSVSVELGPPGLECQIPRAQAGERLRFRKAQYSGYLDVSMEVFDNHQITANLVGLTVQNQALGR